MRCSLAKTMPLVLFVVVSAVAGAEDKSGVTPQVLSLPSGPGSIEGLGGSFEPQLNTGTATYGIELSVPPGVNGHQPNLTLSYNSGKGNGSFGIGWSIDIPYIQRQTDKGVPCYGLPGCAKEDTFIYSDGEELVPLPENEWRTENEASFRRFRLRDTGDWEATEKNGTRHYFGTTPGSRIEHSSGQVFKWCLTRSIDTNGNVIEYSYIRFEASEQLYIWMIGYGADSEAFNEVLFDYLGRPDEFGDFSSGIDVRTAMRCSAIHMTTLGKPVRSYRLDYDDNSLSPPSPGDLETTASLLRKLTQYGDDYAKFLPPVRFAYYRLRNNGAQQIQAVDASAAPSLISEDVEILDANGDSLPDIVKTEPASYQCWLNVGNDTIGQMSPVFQSPGVSIASPSAQFLDVDGDGLTDLVHRVGNGSTELRFYRNLGERGVLARLTWAEATTFENNPPAIFDPGFKVIDLNNDKRIDVMRAIGNDYYFYLNGDDGQWTSPATGTPVQYGIDFTNPYFRISDMNGDRLQDLVFVVRGSETHLDEIHYWPMTGAHQWAGCTGPGTDPCVMRGSLAGANIAGPDNVKLTDVNGDGLTDLVIIKYGQVSAWINLGNNAWSQRYDFIVPSHDSGATAIRTADMNGNGTTDIVYDEPGASMPLRYLDFAPGPKPNLLHMVDNGLGQTTTIEYATSTDYYVQARGSSREWTTRLPISVPVVSRMTTRVGMLNDAHADYVTEFTYWDGYYDGVEKEFRGFGYVEVREIGDTTAPTKITRYWFDVGDIQEALKGKVVAQEVATEDGTIYERTDNLWSTEPRGLGTNGKGIVFALNKQTDTVVFEGLNIDSPLRKRIRTAYEYDVYGNVTEERNYGVIDLDTQPDDHDPAPTVIQYALENDEILTFSTYIHDTTNWILDRKCTERTADLAGVTKAEKHFFYDYSDRNCPEEICATGENDQKCGNLTRQDEWLNTAPPPGYIPTVRNEYDPYGNITRITDANNHFRTIDYDEVVHTFPISETVHLDGYEIQMSATYDYGFGSVLTSTDFADVLTTYDYDTFGRLKVIHRLGGAEETYEYQLAAPISHIVTRVKDGSTDSFFHTYSYFDGLGRELGKKIEAEDGQWRFVDALTFNARRLEDSRWLPLYNSTNSTNSTFEYERPDVVYRTFQKTTTEYDIKDRVVKTTNPKADSEPKATYRRTVYEPLLRHEWDESDNAAEEAEAGEGTPKTLRNDGQDRLVEVIERNHEEGSIEEYLTTYEWSTLGDLTRIEDAQCNVKTIDYDSLRRKTFMNDPDRGHMMYGYDDVGNLTSSTDAKGQVTALTYDFANRIESENYLDQTGNKETDSVDVTYFYDHPSVDVDLGDGTTDTAAFTGGRLSSVKDLSGEEHFSYDARGNIEWTSKHIIDPKLRVLTPYTTRFEYDLMDRVTDLYFPDNDHVHYEHNEASFAERIQGGSDGPVIIDSMAYEPTGQLATVVFGNGVRTNYVYDKRDRLLTLQTGPGGDATFINYEYRYDPVSNITRIVDHRPFGVVPTESPRRNTQAFEYDDLHRLTEVRYARKDDPEDEPTVNHGQIGYTYDSIGNMLSKTSPAEPDTGHIDDDENVNLGAMTIGGGACVEGGESGPCNRLGREVGDPPGPHALTRTSNGSTPDGVYDYDDNGNMTSLDGASLTWDFKDRLVGYQKDGTYALYTYDYTDRRITKLVTQDGRTTQTLYPNRGFEIRPNQAPTKFVFNGETRVARVKGTLDPAQPRLQRSWLSAGWNLLTISVDAGGTIGDVFGGDAIIYTWNGVDYEQLSGLEPVTVGQPLWVEVPTSRVCLALGSYDPSPADIVIPEGQSLVAWPRLEPFVPSVHLAGSATVHGYDASMGDWLHSGLTFPAFLAQPRLPANGTFWFDAPGETAIAPTAAGGLDVLFYHGDHVGSTNAVSGLDEEVIREMAYYPFGTSRSEYSTNDWGVDNGIYRFTGKERDRESDLHYFEARFYASALGRFVSVDPSILIPPSYSADDLSGLLADPQGANSYAYVLNRPVAANDPSGKVANWVIGAAAGGIASGVSNVISQSFSEDKFSLSSLLTDVAVGAGMGALTSGGSAFATVEQIVLKSVAKSALKTLAGESAGAGAEWASKNLGATKETADAIGSATTTVISLGLGLKDLSKSKNYRELAGHAGSTGYGGVKGGAHVASDASDAVVRSWDANSGGSERQ